MLRLVALGHTSPEIARRLHLSVRTVESHRRRLHRKLGVRTRAELVNYAIRHGLLVGVWFSSFHGCRRCLARLRSG